MEGRNPEALLRAVASAAVGQRVVDAEILRRRIDALPGYLNLLEPFGAMDRKRFIAGRDAHHLAERYLHLAIESALDIANHLIAGFEAPDTYRDAFAILTRHGVLDDELGTRLQARAGMRNVLVHLYVDIDHGMTWDAIHNDLGDLRRLAEIAAIKALIAYRLFPGAGTGHRGHDGRSMLFLPQ